MRHQNRKALLNKPADHRRAMLRNLVTSLFLYEKVQTTDAKAKALQAKAERLISLVQKKDEVNGIRELKKVVFSEAAAKNIMGYIQKTDKKSGFTRRTKVALRKGDNAIMVQVELL